MLALMLAIPNRSFHWQVIHKKLSKIPQEHYRNNEIFMPWIIQLEKLLWNLKSLSSIDLWSVPN